MLNFPIFAAGKRIQAAAKSLFQQAHAHMVRALPTGLLGRAQSPTEIGSKNAPPLKKGNKGYGVTLLQASLIDLGYKPPLSTRNKGGPDGIYGAETTGVVWKFRLPT